MTSYSRILQTAYRITIQNPVLWLFGLFVAGGFNLSFFRFPDLSSYQLESGPKLAEIFYFFETHPGVLAAASLAILLACVVSLVITNWARIMLVLTVHTLLKDKTTAPKEQMVKSKGLLWPVIRLSLLTTFLMVIVAAVLFVPPLLFARDAQIQTLVLMLATVIFLPLAFTISCINIYSTFFMVLFQSNVAKSLNLATDFFVSKWTEILAFAVVLAVLYSIGLACGLAVFFLLRLVFEALGSLFPSLPISAIMTLSQVISGLAVWLLIGGLNVFINTTLLLLFLELITPIEKDKEKKKPAAAIVAPASPQ